MRTTSSQLLPRLRSLNGQNQSSLVLLVIKFFKVQVLVKNRLFYTLFLGYSNDLNFLRDTLWPSNDVSAEIVRGISVYFFLVIQPVIPANFFQKLKKHSLETLPGFASDLASFTKKNSVRSLQGVSGRFPSEHHCWATRYKKILITSELT